MDLQGKTTRELNNRLSELKVKLADVTADLKRIERGQVEHELMVRRLKKEIQKKEMELDQLKIQVQKFEKDKFRLENDKRLIKKQIQEVMSAQRNVNR